MIYYSGFAIMGAAIIALRPILDQMTADHAQRVFPVWMTVLGAGIFALLAAFVAGLGLTQILAVVYFVSTVNVIVTLVVAIVLPLFRKWAPG